MRAIPFKYLFVLAVTLLLALPDTLAHSQNVGTGNITGTVTDSSGAGIAGANVTITNTGTGATRVVTANGNGEFVAPFLQSGTYEIVFGGGSFAKVNQKNLVLTVGQTLTVSVTLPAASVTTEVLVTTDPPLLDTQKTESSQTITQDFVADLPVNGRRWDNFVLLTPNVVPDGTTGLVSYRGISGLYNANLVDGVSNQQALFAEARGRSQGAPYVFSADSIKEFQSSVSGYSAEFGQSAGGQVNAITKSGGNSLRGDLFYSLRYPALNALDGFSKWSALHNGGNPTLLTQTVHQQQQFGGSVSGPILKDKLFYFFTYDGFRKVNPVLYTSGTSAATLQGFANSTTTCPLPLTSAQCLAAANFLAQETSGSFSRNLKQDIFFPKLDYQFNSNNHMSASFLWQNFHQPNGYSSGQVISNSGIQQNANADFHERFLVAQWDSILSATMANSMRFQWSRDLETNNTFAPGPGVSVGSSVIGSYGESLAVPRIAEPDEHRWQLFDVASKTSGSHTFKAGVDLNFIHEIMINLFQGNGNYTYNGTAAIAFANWVQDVYAQPGVGRYSSFTQAVDPITLKGRDDFWTKNLAGFAEDTWKVKPSLTLNLGLRYDLQLIPQPPHPYTVRADGTATAIGAAYTSVININYKKFQPRIGFAWNPTKSTVVRGGYGMFFGVVPLSAYYNVRVENGYYQRVFSVGPTAPGAPTGMNVFFTPPGPPLAAPFAGAHLPTAIGIPGAQPLAPHGMDPHFTSPYTHSMDFAVEQSLPWRSTISVGYVGTRGLRLPYAIDVNQLQYAGVTRTYDVVNASGATQSTVTVPYYPTGTRPTADGGFSVAFSGLNTWYNSLAVSIHKQMSHGFSGLINYTYAHTVDAGQTSGGASGQNTGGGAFFGTDVILDPFNRKNHYTNSAINMTPEQGRSDLDMHNRFVMSLVYNSQFHFANRMEAYAINGWTISGTATEQTGVPSTPLMSSNAPACPAPTCSNPALAPMDGGATGGADNTNNVVSSSPGRAPQAIRNGFPGPGVRNIDLRISRDFPIHEQLSFQIVAEAFNAMNHLNGLQVATTAFSYANPGSGANCPASHANTCIAPFVSGTPFGTINNTAGTLYGARQLQMSAKLFF